MSRVGVVDYASLVFAQRRDQVCVLGMGGADLGRVCVLWLEMGKETLVGVDGVRSMGWGSFTDGYIQKGMLKLHP